MTSCEHERSVLGITSHKSSVGNVQTVLQLGNTKQCLHVMHKLIVISIGIRTKRGGEKNRSTVRTDPQILYL